MRVITGDETGLVKLVDVQKREYVCVGGQVQSRQLGVCDMAWQYTKDSSMFCLRKNGCLELWDMKSPEFTLQAMEMGVLPENTGVSVHSISDPERAMCVCVSTEGIVKTLNMVEDKFTELSSFQVSSPISCSVYVCMSSSTNTSRVAVGGLENDVALWDIHTQTPVWKAKNVKNDSLSLRVPVYVTGLSKYGDDGSETLACVTGHRHIRLYDTAAQRRPSVSIDASELTEYRFTAVCTNPSLQSVYVSDAGGGVYEWCMRTLRRLRTYKGPAGSVRDLKLTHNGTHLACVGLDRFLRVYDVNSAKCVSAFYLKNRLNSCLVTAEPFRETDDDGNEVSDDVDDDADGLGPEVPYDMEHVTEEDGDEESYEEENGVTNDCVEEDEEAESYPEEEEDDEEEEDNPTPSSQAHPPAKRHKA